jgi:hypothetical protein
MSEENKEKSFVVKDRRRFDSAGNEKAEAVEAVKISEQPKKQEQVKKEEEPKKIENPTGDEPQYEADPQEMNFSSFVMSLATQALMQLGEIKPPPGMNLEVDKNAARQSIDILGMLEIKTRNNLDKEEAHLLEQILHNLRLSYVKAVS